MPLTPKLRNALRDAKPLPRYMPGKDKSISRADIQAGKQLPRRFGPPRPRPGRPPDSIAKVLGARKPPRMGAPRTNPITPPGGWQERYPAPTRGSLSDPITDTLSGQPAPAQTPQLLTPPAAPASPSGPQLARPVSNAGTNGSNARYFVGPGSGLRWSDERGAWTDGVYFYDMNGLSLDRPDAYVAGLGPANESERYDPWSGRSPSIGGPAPAPSQSPLAALLGTQRAQPSAGADTLAGLLGGGETTPAFDGMGDLPPGYEQLPDELLALIRSLIGQRTRQAPPVGSVL